MSTYAPFAKPQYVIPEPVDAVYNLVYDYCYEATSFQINEAAIAICQCDELHKIQIVNN